jgi:hypothetical protein
MASRREDRDMASAEKRRMGREPRRYRVSKTYKGFMGVGPLTSMRKAGTTVIGSLSMTMPRAMYFELLWKTGLRIRVEKYMTGEIPHSCWTS